MNRPRTFVGAIASTAALAGMMIVGAGGAAQAQPGPAQTPLAGSAVPFTSHAKVLGAVASSQQLSIQVWLTPRVAAAEDYATAASTPGSALFQHYLSPDAYTARFGATSATADKVEAWLRASGFTGIGTDSQLSYVRATAPVSKIDAAFKVRIKNYQASAEVNAGPYALRANDRPVSVPASLAGSVLGVTGLDNAAPILPLVRPGSGPAPSSPGLAKITFPCSHYYAQHFGIRLPSHYGTTGFPTEVCGYTADQLRAAYGVSKANTGKGETVALVELGLTRDMFLTLQDYAKANLLPAPSSGRYRELSLGRGSACGDPFDIEEQLDVEASYDMATGANQLVVGGDSCNTGDYGLQGLFNADVAILDGAHNHPLASVASNSWEGFGETQPVFLDNVENAYLVRAAAEGVGMYFSSGDGSGVETPSSDPYAIAVGGTTLGIGSTGNRLFETGWSTGTSIDVNNKWIFEGEQGAAGGGPSLLWAQPRYQRGVVPASVARAPGNRGGFIRSVPDISADADPFTGIAVGILSFPSKKPPSYSESDIGGTSLASPLVAGIVTAAEQGQHRSFGFIDSAIYRLAGTGAIHDTLPLTGKSPKRWRGVTCDVDTCGALILTTFDDQAASMLGYTGQVTLKGYDNMSGVGTPAGQNFIQALRRLER